MLVVLLKKTDYDTRSTEIENNLNKHNHDKYIITPEFNTLAVVFNARLSQANLVAKTDFDNTVYQALIVKLPKIKQKMSLLKINLKS